MKRWDLRTPLLIVLCVIGVGGLAILLLWPITDMIATHDVGTITGAIRAEHLQTAHETVRSQLLTLGAGAFAAAALAFTALNFRLSRQQFRQSGQQFVEQLELSRRAAHDSAEAERRTLELTEQGQVTDRYTKAIEQLGSDKLDVRIGGIYALERIARDSARDHPIVIEVLSAFIREHSREQWPLAEADGGTPERVTRPDVQAAVTVIGRRNRDYDVRRLNLAGSILVRADLTEANLAGAVLTDACLSRTVLAGTDLSGAFLSCADLRGAFFAGTNLSRAFLGLADLTGDHVSGVNFSGAFLTSAKWPESEPQPDGWVRDPGSGRLRGAE